MKGTGEQIDHQKEENGAEPPWMVHVKEVEEVENLVKTHPVPSNILFTRSILCNQRANDGEDSKKNKDRYGKFERTEEVKEDGEDPLFSFVYRIVQRSL